MLETKNFLNDNYINSILITSTFDGNKSKKRKKIKNIINPDLEFIKLSTFNKLEDSERTENNKEKIKYKSALKYSTKKLKINKFKSKKSSGNLSEKNIKFISKLTNKNIKNELYCSCLDSNRNKKKDKYYNDESLDLIQKNLKKKIKAMKSDNKFLESFIFHDFDKLEVFPEKGKEQQNNNENENEEKDNIKNKSCLSSIIKEKNNNNKILEKLYINSSDNHPFINDLNNNYEELNKSKKIDEDNNSKNINLNKEKKYRYLQIKKLIYDSFDDDEIIEEELLKDDVIYIPLDSKYILIFDYIIILLTLYSLIFIPINISTSVCFKYFHFVNLLNYFMDLTYIIDLILPFFRPYYNFEEQLVYNNSKIILHNLYNYFMVDLICSIPFYSIFKIIEKDEQKCFLINLSIKLDNLYKIFEIVKILKIIKIVDKKTNLAINNIIKFLDKFPCFENYEFLFEFFLSLSVIHITTCIHIFISRNSYPNWIISNNLIESSYISIYFTSFYFIITTLTTVGYGDITGKNIKETIFQIYLLIFGIVAYSWLISNLSNMILEKNKMTELFNEKVRILDNIRLQYNVMNEELYTKIYRYLEYTHFNYKKNPKMIIDTLPYSLKKILLNEMYKPLINNFNFFKNFKNSSFILEIVRKLYPIRVYKNEILLDQGDLIENMIFIKEGRLNLEVKINIDNPVESVNKLLNEDIILGVNEFSVKNFDFMYETFTNKDLNIYDFNNFSSNSSIKKDKEKKINFLHLKILEIRKGEHFGGLLIFLDRRTPLTLRVKTKKADLYFLKKIDAIEISSNYSNIWKRVNRISFHNLKQISKYMKKIIKQYCDTYGIKYQTQLNQNLNHHKYKKIKFKLDENEDNKKKRKQNEQENINVKVHKSILKNSKKSKLKSEKKEEYNNDNKKIYNNEKNTSKLNEINEKNNCEKNDIDNIDNENKKSDISKEYGQNDNINNECCKNINKKRSKFYQNQNKENITSLEKKNFKITEKKYGLTPFSPKEINDEIYKGEKFILKPVYITKKYTKNSNIAVKSDISSRNFMENKILSMRATSFSIVNLKNNNYKKNIKIIKNINIEFLSRYENINEISKNKYAYDKHFQSHIKKIIKKYSNKITKMKNIFPDTNTQNSIKNKNKFSKSSNFMPKINKKILKNREKLINKDNENISNIYLSLKNNDFKTDEENDVSYLNKINNKSDKTEEEKDTNNSHPQNGKVKKKSLNFLNKISKKINEDTIVLNNPKEFYSELFNNIINNIDKNNNKKKNEKQKKSLPMPIINLKRNSKTFNEL